MKKPKQEIVIRCFFTEEGEDLKDIISQSLRAFIKRSLENGGAA